MAAPNTNWVYDKGIVTERDRAAAARAERQDARDIKRGYRWIRVNPRTKALVECDANGEPTELGRKQIETASKF